MPTRAAGSTASALKACSPQVLFGLAAMASDLAAPTNIFVFTKLHKVLEVLAKQCQLARVACSRLDTPHEGDPGTAVDLYQVAVSEQGAPPLAARGF